MVEKRRREEVLSASGLSVGYDGRSVIKGVDLSVAPHEIVTLVGPNGAGKSTLLKTVAGHLDPLAGELCLDGRPLSGMATSERARLLAVMLTDRLRTELLTCADVVEMGRYPHTGAMGLLREADREKVREAMEMTHVWNLRDQDFMRLSDGQRQRVLLARAICQEPRLLVLDEPTSHLDIHYQIELLEMARELVETREVGVLMSLHELPLAWEVSDRLVCIKNGVVLAQGASGELRTPGLVDELFDLAPGTFDPMSGGVSLRLRCATDAGRS